MNRINYNDFMQNKTVPHSNGNYTGAFILLKSSPSVTAATYDVNKVIVVPVHQMTHKTTFYYD